MFSRLSRRFPGSRASRHRAVRPLQVEGLEGRTLLSLNAIDFGATVTSQPVAVGNELFFVAQDAAHGKQVWGYNTSQGATRITDGNGTSGINPNYLTAVGNTLYFEANNGSASRGGQGGQLWAIAPGSDGSYSSASMITAINPQGGGLGPSQITAVGGALDRKSTRLNSSHSSMSYAVFCL